MRLNRVTITGADDTIDPQDMLSLSKEFPFVEWGILMSASQQGAPRFPSTDWMNRLSRLEGMNLSAHLCGRWVRNLLQGLLDWSDIPPLHQNCRRIQINTHAHSHVVTAGMIPRLMKCRAWRPTFIFQWDGVNDFLTHLARSQGLDAAALFDKSGGAGILPETWPPASREFPCGFAGGIGPENVVAQIARIEQGSGFPDYYWIDMERRVRSEDDSRFDGAKVRKVLELTAPLVTP